jgi:hypothetical protein
MSEHPQCGDPLQPSDMSKPPTSKENIALTLISRRLGESFINRTPEDYEAIKAKLPPTKVLHGWVNDDLKVIAAAKSQPYDICYFKAGDQHIWYESFPISLSIEVVRSALVNAGFRKKQVRERKRR